MQDLKVTINNYIASDTYLVNVYKQYSQIPLTSKSVPVNGGASVVFMALPDGIMEVEVIHSCSTGTPSTSARQSTASSNTNSCTCPSGYVHNSDNTRCVRTTSVPASVTGSNLQVGKGPTDVNYCSGGLRVYAQGFTIGGDGSILYTSGPDNPYWACMGDLSKGRLNIAGIWNAASPTDPKSTWIGFSQKISVPAGKIYYIAAAGDNYIRIKVNGVVVVDQTQYTGTEAINRNFNYWHCFPVYLNTGDNYIEVQGYNNSNIGCFAAEIYSCDLNTIKTITTETEILLNRIFTTLGATTFDTNYSCPDGYALDSSNLTCKKVEYTSCL